MSRTSAFSGKIAAACLGVAALATLAGCNTNGSGAATQTSTAAAATSAAAGAATTGASTATAGASSAATGSGSTSAAGAGSATIFTCEGQSTSQPATYILACGDGSDSLTGLAWSNWGSATATATGKYEADNCTPNCAAGTQQSFTATITVTGLSNGTYTSMTINAPQANPSSQTYAISQTGPAQQQ